MQGKQKLEVVLWVVYCVTADQPETRPLAKLYSDVVPAQGSVVDLLSRARNKQTGEPLKPHEIIAQVGIIASLQLSLGQLVLCQWSSASTVTKRTIQ